ncbi:hypothetical protein VNO77_02773 [Canavalia gladiata]|uniref:Uncharacterized protein n=1 Tax=Canavalia gladiata TaxID=3824 RepID=A0AAN9MVN4_CANGL
MRGAPRPTTSMTWSCNERANESFSCGARKKALTQWVVISWWQRNDDFTPGLVPSLPTGVPSYTARSQYTKGAQPNNKNPNVSWLVESNSVHASHAEVADFTSLEFVLARPPKTLKGSTTKSPSSFSTDHEISLARR